MPTITVSKGCTIVYSDHSFFSYESCILIHVVFDESMRTQNLNQTTVFHRCKIMTTYRLMTGICVYKRQTRCGSINEANIIVNGRVCDRICYNALSAQEPKTDAREEPESRETGYYRERENKVDCQRHSVASMDMTDSSGLRHRYKGRCASYG